MLQLQDCFYDWNVLAGKDCMGDWVTWVVVFPSVLLLGVLVGTMVTFVLDRLGI